MIITPTGRHGIFADRDKPELKSPRRARAALPKRIENVIGTSELGT